MLLHNKKNTDMNLYEADPSFLVLFCAQSSHQGTKQCNLLRVVIIFDPTNPNLSSRKLLFGFLQHTQKKTALLTPCRELGVHCCFQLHFSLSVATPRRYPRRTTLYAQRGMKQPSVWHPKHNNNKNARVTTSAGSLSLFTPTRVVRHKPTNHWLPSRRSCVKNL